MARFFKFIFRVLLIAYIAVALALVVPPLIGYTTAAVMEKTEGNQNIGTVVYAKRIPLTELNVGEKILVSGSDSVNVFTVQAVDTENAIVTVADRENQEIPVRSYVYRMIIAAPFIGYLLIALQSVEGIVVLALTTVLLILLCILTGIWSKRVKEKRRMEKAAKAEKKAADKKSGRASEAEGQDEDPENGVSMSPRAEAYFAKRKEELSRPAPDEEYEDFPPKTPPAAATIPAPAVSPVRPVQEKIAEPQYFDEEEDNEDADSWLHDDVDDDDLFAGLNNRAASESLMATARLFAISRAAQAKERMAVDDAADQTRVVTPDEVAQVKEQAATVKPDPSAVVRTQITAADARTKTPMKEIVVDKVVNLKELKEADSDDQQIVLTINIKVLSE